MTWFDAKLAATQHTGRTPRWCDVSDDNGNIAPAPSTAAMDDCIALDMNGNSVEITHWMNDVPHAGEEVAAICYF